MKSRRHTARECLTNLSLRSFWNVVREAKITDEDQEVLDLRFVRGHSIVQISQELHMSVEKVNKIIRRCYDKIARLL